MSSGVTPKESTPIKVWVTPEEKAGAFLARVPNARRKAARDWEVQSRLWRRGTGHSLQNALRVSPTKVKPTRQIRLQTLALASVSPSFLVCADSAGIRARRASSESRK